MPGSWSEMLCPGASLSTQGGLGVCGNKASTMRGCLCLCQLITIMAAQWQRASREGCFLKSSFGENVQFELFFKCLMVGVQFCRLGSRGEVVFWAEVSKA